MRAGFFQIFIDRFESFLEFIEIPILLLEGKVDSTLTRFYICLSGACSKFSSIFLVTADFGKDGCQKRKLQRIIIDKIGRNGDRREIRYCHHWLSDVRETEIICIESQRRQSVCI